MDGAGEIAQQQPSFPPGEMRQRRLTAEMSCLPPGKASHHHGVQRLQCLQMIRRVRRVRNSSAGVSCELLRSSR